MNDQGWTTVSRKSKRQQSKPLSVIVGSPSSSASLLSATLVASTPKTNEVLSLNSDLRLLYEHKQKKIDENEAKILNCSNKQLLNYYIHQNEELTKQQTILLQHTQLSDSLDSLTLILKKMDGMDQRMRDMEEHLRKLRISKIKELDIWPGNRTQIEQTNFKDELIINYQCGNPNYNNIKCMMLNAYFSRDVVRASHIWKYCTNGTGLTEFGLHYNDLNNYRNGLLMYTAIEQAFDRKELCFIYNPFQEKLLLKILHNGAGGITEKAILYPDDQKKYNNETKFKDIDGKPLNLPEKVYPFRRLLNWHARCAHEYAKTKGWIPETDNFDDFDDLSDLVSLPGDDLNEQQIDSKSVASA